MAREHSNEQHANEQQAVEQQAVEQPGRDIEMERRGQGIGQCRFNGT